MLSDGCAVAAFTMEKKLCKMLGLLQHKFVLKTNKESHQNVYFGATEERS